MNFSEIILSINLWRHVSLLCKLSAIFVSLIYHLLPQLLHVLYTVFRKTDMVPMA